MAESPLFETVAITAAQRDPGMAHTIQMYEEHGLMPPRFFQARALLPLTRAERYLIVIFGHVPLPPRGKVTPYMSMTSSSFAIPHHNVGPRPTDAEFFAACRQIAPGVNFKIDKQGSPFCIHGFAD